MTIYGKLEQEYTRKSLISCVHCARHATVRLVTMMNPYVQENKEHGGLDFSEETGYRDVFLGGKCDDGCLELARLLGLEVKRPCHPRLTHAFVSRRD
jgi:hypothetical protein